MTRSTVRVAMALLLIALALPVVSLVAARADSVESIAVERPARTVIAVAGERVVIGGAVPQRVRRPVALQRRIGGHWRQVDRARTSRAGRYSFDLRARAATYRVVARSVQAGRERLPAWTSRRTIVRVLPKHVPPTITAPVPAPPADKPPADNPPAGRKPWVTGYYAAWFWEWLYPPQEVDMTAMTHFVFGRVAPGGGSLGGDPTELMDGAWSAQEPNRAPDGSGDSIEDYLVGRAHAAGTKALLMLGGDGADGRGFLKSTATPQLQGEFVDNVVDYLVEHDYDGVDLDWENCLDGHPDCVDPGEEPVTAREAQQRLLGLIDAIRAELATRDRYAATPGLLTFPGYATKINENGGRPEPWQTDVALKVDQYNLMTYGVGTTWNGGGWLSWFSGALFGAGGLNPVDISSSVAAYQASGVPRERIGIGIGFYGIYYGPGITAPRQSTDDNRIYEVQDAPLSYSELDRMGYLTHGTRHWDEEAKSTYRLYDGGYVPALDPGRYPAGLLSYEDEQSITAKGDWVRETGVGGTILWTINYGWLPRTGTNPLMDAVKSSFLE